MLILTHFLQLMVSYPPPPPAASRPSRLTLSSAFPLKAGVAAVLQESVRSSSVRTLSTMLLDLRKELDDLIRMTRCPVILILDKVCGNASVVLTRSFGDWYASSPQRKQRHRGPLDAVLLPRHSVYYHHYLSLVLMRANQQNCEDVSCDGNRL